MATEVREYKISINYLAEVLGMHSDTVRVYLCHYTLCKYVKRKQFNVCDESITKLYEYLDKKRLYKACDRLKYYYPVEEDNGTY